MQFDKDQYKEFLTRHSKEGTDPVDLLERYAITLSASTSDADVKAQVTAVRAYWNQTANGNSRAAKKADWCRKRDAELKAQLGDQLETVAWWRESARAEAGKAQAAIDALAQSLRQAYGQLGVVTADDLARDGARNKLSAAQAAQAAGLAGLPVISEKVTLPEPPLSSTAFKDLVRNLSDCQVPTIPELLHPGSGPFRIVARYECLKDPALRLDVEAIDQQKAEAGKAINPTNTARLDALRKLSDAVQRKIDPRDVALYHLMELVADTQPVMAKQELQRAGVEESDAATIAALLQRRQKASRVSHLDQVLSRLADGQLAEAAALASTIPDGDEKAEAGKQVAARQQELGDLLAKAEAAWRQADEAQAERHLRAAALISQADADDMLRRLPLAPPGEVTVTGDGASVRLSWQPGRGHDPSTEYVVTWTRGRAPASPSDGTPVHRGAATECADSSAPAATEVQYGVFATAGGRPPSRPVTVTVRPVPPVWDLRSETGIGTVSLHWQAKPEAQVRVTRAAPGAAPVLVPVPPGGRHIQLRDLPDGVTQVFEVVAAYRGPNGAELLSLPQTATATPRGEARPNDTLRVTTALAGGQTRVRASWKQVDNSEVRILLTASEQPWPFRTVISPDEARRGGTLLAGSVEASGADRTLEAVLPGGMHYLTPLSEGGTGVAVGLSKPVAIIDPVTNLVSTPFAGHASIAWHWPATVQLAEVSWRAQGDDDSGWDSAVLSRAEYESKGGAQVPLGARPVDVEVRAVITANGKRYPSAPASVSVAKVVKTPIRYQVAGGPFSGRSRKVTFTADEPCAGTMVRMVVVPGKILPTRPNEGVVVLETTLSLTPGVPAVHRAELPKSIKKPYWVRCFVMSGPGRLIDPPTGDLKED